MKLFISVFFTAMLSANQAYAMTTVEVPNTGGGTVPTSAVQQSGKVDAIYAGASKLVINGVTYAYDFLTTVVTLNGKRVTISDVRMGDTVQFQATPQGANKASLLTTVSVQRR